jgi:hypothetical protein
LDIFVFTTSFIIIALAFIAFAAGNELYIRELMGFFDRIRWVSAGLGTNWGMPPEFSFWLSLDITD